MSPSRQQAAVIDLLEQDWSHAAGVAQDGDRLRVAATGLSIVEQDGGGGQPDPPVNLAGTHLTTAGDFLLRASLSDVEGDAAIAVYDTPPVIADEFRIEPAGVRLTLRGDDLRIDVFDGSPSEDATDPQPAEVEHVTVPDAETEFSLSRIAGRIDVAVGDETLSSLPLGDVFRSGEIWLGLSSEEGSFAVRSLTAAGLDGDALSAAGPVVVDAEPRPNGLQTLAERSRPGFLIGAAVALGPLASDPDYAGHVVGDFGALTIENAMKPQALSPRRGEYTFQEADAIVDLARSKGIAVHGHTIAFSEAMPAWMRELPAGTVEERRGSADILLDYITTVVTHFAGRLTSLDVVNEPFDVDQGTSLQENIWYRVFGAEYPVAVSRAVHAADPSIRQFINENGADVPGPRQDALLELALDTNERGGHIDGVGLQAHVYDLDTDAISVEDLAATFRHVEDAGLIARISENDVPDAEGQDVQAEQYAAVLETCLRSPVCVSYTTWGVDDRYDWSIDGDGAPQQGHDLLFDDGRPTPAYDALQRVLRASGEGEARRDPAR
ncbi:endo-1,4-beta-xylanase [Microbacterium sp. 1P10UB]|uniref:endo-1,4-beta-xylanase n=1 Tax=unclassified Microbacterium TaxID=2609290 RepID=UPI0039A0B598